MTLNGGDIIADIISSHQIPYIFTLCGGHISPILVAGEKKGIKIIDVRDEANAVFAADAYARITGKPGIAVVTAGPGVTNTITAMKNAQMAQSPVILLGGAAATIIKGRGSLQDIEQVSLLQSIVKQAATINQNCDIVPVLENAIQVAMSDTPGPVFIECPIDLLYGEELVREWYGSSSNDKEKQGLKSKLFQFYLDHHVDKMFACDFENMHPAPKSATVPELKMDRVKKAATLLSEAEKPVCIVGSQAMLNHSEIHQLKTAIIKLGIPVYLTGMARGLMGRDHELQMRHQRSKALKEADLVILAGMPCDFRLGYGRSISSKAKIIAVNRNRTDLNMNRKPDLGLLSDPHEMLCQLAELSVLPQDYFNSWVTTLRVNDKNREQSIASQAKEETDFINPLRFFEELEEFMEENSVLVADGGDFVATASYILKPRKPFSWLDPGVFGTLGVGAGFSIGAQLSDPKSEVWLIYGDGAAGYSLQEVDTLVRHKLPVIAIIGNDASWAQIARDQVEVLKSDVATTLQRSDYQKVFEAFGGKGLLLDHPSNIKDVLIEARETTRKGIPVCINVLIGKTDFRKGSISM